MYQENGNILDVRITSTSVNRVLRLVRNKIKEGKKFYIFTPNPEIIVEAQKDEDFMTALNKADLSLPDGIGIVAARKFLKLPNPKNPLSRPFVLFVQGLGVGFSLIFNRKWVFENFNLVKGREMFMELIKLSNKKRWKVYLLGGEHDESFQTKEILGKSFKKIKLESGQGPMLDKNAKTITSQDQKTEKKIIESINKFKPHLLFVAFKFPRQEKWVASRMEKLNIGGAMVVGGTYNYISGRSKLPPGWIEEIGLEWLWRLFNEPNRINRILNATTIFSIKVFLQKLNTKGKE